MLLFISGFVIASLLVGIPLIYFLRESEKNLIEEIRHSERLRKLNEVQQELLEKAYDRNKK